eukprot:346804-Rhodomonas_salina.1
MRGGEGLQGCGVKEEGKDREGAVSKGRRRTARVRRRGGGEGQQGCCVEGEEKDRKGAASRSRRGTARVR